MSPHYPSPYYRQPLSPETPPHSPPPSPYLQMGKIGAVVGLCGAGAANIRRLQEQQVSGGEALVDTLRAGVASGLATAAASMVAGRFRDPTLGLLATLTTGTAVMYALGTESSTRRREGP